MRNCSETKRKNNDNKILAGLTATLTYYQDLGYRSKQPTPQLNNAQTTVYRRKRMGQPIPKSWHRVLEQIYALPTENEWKKRQELQQAAQLAAVRAQRQQDLMQYIPNLGIFKTVFGEMEYNKLLDSPIDPAVAMVFSEIVDTVTPDINNRAFYMLKLQSGYQPMSALQQTNDLGKCWSVPELCELFGLTQPRVHTILAKEYRRIQNNLGKYFECLINNDVETMLKDFSHITGLRQRYESYRKYKIRGINPKDMFFAGEWLKNAIVVKQK